MSTFRLPDLGEGLQDAEIVSWHVATGDHVVADQPLLTVETAKAVVEIPSPQSGIVARLHGMAGDVVPIGAPLVEFGGEERTDQGAVVGELPAATPVGKTTAPEDKAAPAKRPTVGVKAVPAVRAQARKLGVDLEQVSGTGPHGAVTSDDVRKAAKREASGARIERVRGVRRAMAQNMVRSGAEVVPATVNDEADVDHWGEHEDATIRLARAIAEASATEPALNAWYDSAAGERWLHPKLDLGIAMDTPDGLFVPALRDVGGRDDDDLRRGLEAMKRDIRARSVPPEELRGQTFTLSNFGMIGGRHVSLVIVPPQVAILGAGRFYQRYVPVDEAPRAHRMLPLSLTFDHRVVAGAEAARFMAAVIAALEH